MERKGQEMAISAVYIALVFVMTLLVQIRLPIAANGGLVHLGNVPLFIAAALYGKKTGAIAGGIGMALFDLVGGWFLWAPFTLVICGMIGLSFGIIVNKRPTWIRLILASVIACIIKVVGYYVAEWIIYGNFLTPMASVAGNITQMIAGAVVAIPIILICKNSILQKKGA